MTDFTALEYRPKPIDPENILRTHRPLFRSLLDTLGLPCSNIPSDVRMAFWARAHEALNRISDYDPQKDPGPFRLMDLPYELRAKIFHFAITGANNFFLDREVAVFGESFQTESYRRGHLKWRGANGVYVKLLCLNKQVRWEVELMLFRQFAFYSSGWGYLMKYSDPSKTPNRLPKNKIRHLAYTPHKCRNFREHRMSVEMLLAEIPMLCDVRIMVTPLAVKRLTFCGSSKVGTEHIVAVAQLFRSVGKVAVIGQALNEPEERAMVEEARDRLRKSNVRWYWELDINYQLLFPSATAIRL